MSVAAILFWVSALGFLYTYAGYPLLIGLLARVFPRPVRKAPNELTISVVMSVYNDAPRLAEKLRNILSCEGAERIREILVGSDGSTDDPAGAAAEVADPRVKLTVFPERRGKPSVLNDLIPRAAGDVLVMMDVRQRLDPHALPALLDNFSDPAVGVVSGELIFETPDQNAGEAGGIDAYWRYEKWIRARESRFASVPGATGALYALRRELAAPIPAEAALDDVILPMQAIARGARCIFESGAKIYDVPAADAAREAIRKRRTLAGCVQLLRWYPAWSVPFAHPIGWQFGSHKIARLFSPALLAVALASSLALIGNPLYAVLAGLQAAAYALALLGAVGIPGLPAKAWMFLAMQRALVLAWVDGLGRRNLALWRKAELPAG